MLIFGQLFNFHVSVNLFRILSLKENLMWNSSVLNFKSQQSSSVWHIFSELFQIEVFQIKSSQWPKLVLPPLLLFSFHFIKIAHTSRSFIPYKAPPWISFKSLGVSPIITPSFSNSSSSTVMWEKFFFEIWWGLWIIISFVFLNSK